MPRRRCLASTCGYFLATAEVIVTSQYHEIVIISVNKGVINFGNRVFGKGNKPFGKDVVQDKKE